MISPEEFDSLKKFRQTLHRYPELSGQEVNTATRIVNRLRPLQPDALLEKVGGHGVVAIFRSPNPGPSIMVRVDMDALPISETNEVPYSSVNPGVAHLCGHDGHTAIGLALAGIFGRQRPDCGEVLILFQPSEENGKGASQVLNDPAFRALRIDKVIALHNLPGFPVHEIVVKDGPFACASEGLDIRLLGKTAHAAQPEHGINPVDTLTELIRSLESFRMPEVDRPFRLATVVHLKVGEEAYGISPADGRLLLTLRAETDALLGELRMLISDKARYLAQRDRLSISMETAEPFAATSNDNGFTADLRDISGTLGLTFTACKDPFRWSEDVGTLIAEYGGGLFGLGAGKHMPALHNPDYDFPDELILTGASVFYEYIKLHQKNAENILY